MRAAKPPNRLTAKPPQFSDITDRLPISYSTPRTRSSISAASR